MSVDVAVVGCGPVGAVAANLLGQAGLSAEVVERTPSIYHLSRAAHFDAEIMRIFQGLGLVPEVLPACRPTPAMHFVDAEGERLVGLDLPQRTRQGWASGYTFYEPDLLRALRAGIERYPQVSVRLGDEAVAVAQHADGVTLGVRDAAGAEREVEARYLIAADGATSTVRGLLGIDVEDLGLEQDWLVVDTMLRRPVDLPGSVLHICDPERPVTYVPSAGEHRRWEFMLLDDETAEEMQRPEVVRDLLAPWLGPDDAEVLRAHVYTFRAAVARRWREGRVFLGGDAAHELPPFLGQGMGSGVRDVTNLVWKLASVLSGRADGSLLDTYEQERAPHVRGVAEISVRLGRAILTTDPEAAAALEKGEGRLPALDAGVIAPGGPPAGKLGPQPRVRTERGGELLDEAIGPRVALIARRDPRSVLDAEDLAFWDELDAAFIAVASAGGGRPEVAEPTVGVVEVDSYLDDLLDTDDALLVLRPDRYVFGVGDPAEITAAFRGHLRP